MIDILKTLTSLSGPCGYEHAVTYFLKEYLEDKVDEVSIDPIGNVIAKKRGDKPGPTVLLTAHIDEIGFIVKKIEANGLLRFEKHLGVEDRVGSIEVGKDADFVLWSGDPFDLRSKVEQTYINGELIFSLDNF